MRKTLEALAVAAVLSVLGYFYLAPNSGMALSGDTSHLLSEGGDASGVPFQYHAILNAARHHPSHLLFGTVYTDQVNAPEGIGLWIPWFERLNVLALSPFLSLEGLATGTVWTSMILNGLLIFLLGRRRGWPFPIGLALGICFAFNPYTRARSISHLAMVGLFYLPAAFLALDLLRTVRRKREWFAGSTLLLLAVSGAQYYVMVLVALAPFLLGYFLRGQADKPRALGRLTLAALPAVLFLAWNLLAPLPFDLDHRPSVQQTSLSPEWLDIYGARAIDYFTGDVAFGNLDWNPLRAALTQSVRLAGFNGSNNLERSNGIRWSLLLIFGVAVGALLVPSARKRLDPACRSDVFYFSVLAVAAFFLSLRPEVFGGYGPALWVQKILPHFRVPSRFGPVVHFAVLGVAGATLTRIWALKTDRNTRIAFGVFLPLALFLEFPPLHPTWADSAPAARTELILASTGTCGTGMYFPYLAVKPGTVEEFEFYKAFQTLKRTPCRMIGMFSDGPLNQRLHATLGTETFAASSVRGAQREVEFLRCSGSEWVVFRPLVPAELRARMCQELGWTMTATDSCRNPQGSKAAKVEILGCI